MRIVRKKSNSGFTLLETLIASIILGIGLIAGISYFALNKRALDQAKGVEVVLQTEQDLRTRFLAFVAYFVYQALIPAATHTFYCDYPPPVPPATHTRTINITAPNFGYVNEGDMFACLGSNEGDGLQFKPVTSTDTNPYATTEPHYVHYQDCMTKQTITPTTIDLRTKTGIFYCLNVLPESDLVAYASSSTSVATVQPMFVQLYFYASYLSPNASLSLAGPSPITLGTFENIFTASGLSPQPPYDSTWVIGAPNPGPIPPVIYNLYYTIYWRGNSQGSATYPQYSGFIAQGS